MADEAQIRSSLQIKKTSGSITQIDYSSKPTSFKADVTGTKGPTPGVVAATVAGVNVDLSALTTPGLCRMHNQDATNYVSYGIWDPDNNKFFPLGELLAGESYTLRLSRVIQEEYGTGTGTTGAGANQLRLKADTASVNVLVEAFEK